MDINRTANPSRRVKYINGIFCTIKNETDRNKKAELIYELLEMIRATLFRQSMFAEFEKEVHEKIENNEMLSAEI